MHEACPIPASPALQSPLVALPGQRIGLLGGSFDPAHQGHLHITLWAMRALGLDRVWWLVSPGNPLKERGPAPLPQRMHEAARIARHPRVIVTDIESRIRTRYTADTLAALGARHPGVSFIWLMGADNLASLHRWERWEWIMSNVPVAVLARPGEQLRAGLSPAAIRFARWRRRQADAAGLGRGGAETYGKKSGNLAAPDWVLLTGSMSPLSSTSIRRQYGR